LGVDSSFSEKFLKRLLGRNDVEDALKRLDKLTQEEAKMATAEVLKITRGMDSNVKVMDTNLVVLIDGAHTLLVVIQVLMLYVTRWQGGKRHRATGEAFVIFNLATVSLDAQSSS
jgi:hypothetical protein